MIVRLCKAALVATTALFFALVAFGNMTDYDANWAFVRHVLAMDSIFPNSTLTWRAITNPQIAAAAYWGIIGWQAVTAVVLGVATARLLGASRDPGRFARSKPVACLGLTFGLLLYGLGFTVIGGEWFAMWQSQSWNGLNSATRFILLDGLVLLVLLTPEA